MIRPESPCLFCTRRHIGCHTKCDKYNQYSKEQKEYREHISKQRFDDNEIETIEIQRFRK